MASSDTFFTRSKKVSELRVVAKLAALVGVAGLVGVLARMPEEATEPPSPDPPPPDTDVVDEPPMTVVHGLGPRWLTERGRSVRIRSGGGPPLVAATPDGRHLALVVHPEPAAPPRLVMLDTDRMLPLTGGGALPAPVADLDVSPDGEWLVWVQQASDDDPAMVRRIALASPPSTGHDRVPLPGSVEPDELVALDEGRAVVRGTGANGVPRLVLVDLASGVVAGDVGLLLPGLGGTDAGTPAAGPRLTAAFAWDAVGERGFVAHPDADRVTVLDLATLERLGALDAGPGLLGGVTGAATRGTPAIGVSRDVALSPDGERLYLGGWRVEVERPGAGEARRRELPLGFVVFDTNSGEVLHRGRPLAQQVAAVGPDGRTVVMAGGWWADGDPRTGRIADPETLATTARLGEGGPIDAVAYAPSGRHAIVARQSPGRATVTSWDTRRGQVVAERTLEANRVWLVPHARVVVTWR